LLLFMYKYLLSYLLDIFHFLQLFLLNYLLFIMLIYKLNTMYTHY